MEKTNHDFYIGENKYHITGITFTHRENKYHIYIPGKQIMTFTYQENKYHIYNGKINHDIYIGENKYHIYIPGKQISHYRYHIYTPGKQISHLHTRKPNITFTLGK